MARPKGPNYEANQAAKAARKPRSPKREPITQTTVTRALSIMPDGKVAAYHEPTALTREQVKTFKGMGLEDKQIAALLGITNFSLNKHYTRELTVGTAFTNLEVAKSLYEVATDTKHKSFATAAMFWLRTKGRFIETTKHEVSGPDGGAIKYESTIDPRTLTLEERDLLKQLMVKALEKQKEAMDSGEGQEFQEIAYDPSPAPGEDLC